MAHSWNLLSIIFVVSLEPLWGQDKLGLTPDQMKKALETAKSSPDVAPEAADVGAAQF